MNTKWHLASATALVLILGGCAAGEKTALAAASDNFGEANRQTMMAQVLDPTPDYETAVPVSSGEHAAQAIDRYRKDQVKKPERLKTTNAGLSGSGSSGN